MRKHVSRRNEEPLQITNSSGIHVVTIREEGGGALALDPSLTQSVKQFRYPRFYEPAAGDAKIGASESEKDVSTGTWKITLSTID